MAKKSAISGEYIIEVLDNGSIASYRIFDNVKSALREAAEAVGFEYDNEWTTRQFGAKLVNEYGADNKANVGNYVITKDASGSISCYRTYDNTLGALREVAEKIGFEYDKAWTTRQFGSKLVDYVNLNK